MLVFASSIGFATFIENDYGTMAAKSLIFNSWWLELCLLLLCAIFVYNIFQYNLYKIRKLPTLFLHLSFIFIIIGSGITRYIGKDGVMRIREGGMNNQFISSSLFLDFKIHDNKKEYSSQKKLLLSSVSNNQFSIPINFEDIKINIEYLDFIHDPIDNVVYNEIAGRDVLEFIIPASSGGMQSEYISRHNTKKINGLNVSFESEFKSDFEIYQNTKGFYFKSKYDVEYMNMENQLKGVLFKNKQHPLNHKVLYTVNGKNMVFKSHTPDALINQISNGIKNDDSKSDLLKLKLTVEEVDTIISLYGNKGLISPKTYFYFNNFFFSFSYGSKNYSLPFAIFLKDFQLERYPGSDSPSSFASEIEVIDGQKKIDYRIFMNNVLNYRGYRFFQSSYDKDEKGTILSVNKDRWGTIVTYAGYLSLLISVLSLIIYRFSRINLLSKQINNRT